MFALTPDQRYLITKLLFLLAALPQVAISGPDACPGGDCQGNQSAGISVTAPPNILNVHNLTGPIQPSSGTPGIRLGSDGGLDLTINSGDSLGNVSIITNQASGIVASSQGTPPSPQNDPLLNVPIPGNPGVSGGVVRIESYSDITTGGTNAHGIFAQSNTTGYPSSVITALENFSDAGISFKVTSVKKPDGTEGGLDTSVSARIAVVDETGDLPVFTGYAGEAGSFTISQNGTFSFNPGTAFDGLAVGEKRIVSVKYVLDGYRNDVLKRSGVQGELIAQVTRTASGLEVAKSAFFEDFGDSDKPQTDGKAWPDLNSYVAGLVDEASGAGGAGNSVDVFHRAGIITTNGAASHGILAKSAGRVGSNGRHGGGFWSFGTRKPTEGGAGRPGGDVSIHADGSITTKFEGALNQPNQASIGVLAHSLGGNGGRGGNGGTYYYGRRGGSGGNGGLAEVFGSAVINTDGHFASGILALSEGGDGGDGGDGADVTGGGAGGFGGKGGPVVVNGNWNITTRGDNAHGIWAKSMGGNAGTGGSGGWLAGAPAPGGQATDGGTVSLISGGEVTTWGSDAYGLFAQSVGGFGGSGGSGGSIFYSRGGNGNSAGSGGAVSVTNQSGGEVITHGTGAHAVYAQSIGGGGGAGGGGSGIVGVGGSGAAGGFGGIVEANNAGVIQTYGENARGIYAQSIGGGGGDGGNSAGLVAVGGGGSGTSDGGNVTVTNSGVIETANIGGNAIFAQSIGGGGGSGGSSSGWFSIGGSGGGGGNAGQVVVNNSGTKLQTAKADASAVFAQSVGGGGGKGGNSVAVGAFVSLAIGGSGAAGGKGDNVSVNSLPGEILTSGDRSYGIFAQSIGGGGGDGGFAVSASAGIGGSLAIGVGGAAGGGGDSGLVNVVSHSHIVTKGNDADGVFAESIGGGGGTGGFAISGAASDGVAVSLAFGGKGGSGGDGKAVVVRNFGAIETGVVDLTGKLISGNRSIGLQAQSVGGGGGSGGFAITGAGGGLGALSFGLGGKGGGGGNANTVSVENGNNGRITTLGEAAHALLAQSVGGGGGNGGFNIAAAGAGMGAGAFGIGGSGGDGGDSNSVTVKSWGALDTTGDQAVGLFAQSVGGGGGSGGFSITGAGAGVGAGTFNLGGSGGGGGVSQTVLVNSYGNITTRGAEAHGLVAQSIGGGGGNGGFSITGSGAGVGAGSIGIGGSGGGGGNSNLVTVTSDGMIETLGDRAVGLFAQSVGGGGGSGGFSIAGAGAGTGAGTFSLGGSGGDGGDGHEVSVTSSSDIFTLGIEAHALFAQSVGGGGGRGGFSIAGAGAGTGAGTFSLGGSAGGGGDSKRVDVMSTGTLATTGAGAIGLFAQSVGGGGGTGGFSIAGAGAGTGAGTFSLGGSGGDGGHGHEVWVNSASNIFTLGEEAHALFAQSVGGGGGTGGFNIAGTGAGTGAGTFSLGGSAGGGGDSKRVDVMSTGTLATTGAGAIGLFAQSVGGGGGTGGFSIAGAGAGTGAGTFSIGGSGGVGGHGHEVWVNSTSDISTLGEEAHALFAQSLGGGGGTGGFNIAGTGAGTGAGTISLGGSAGGGGEGKRVDVSSMGTLVTEGAGAIGLLAQSVGGGGGSGGFSIAGTGAGKGAGTLNIGGAGGGGGGAGEVTVDNGGAILTRGDEAYGLFAQSIGGGGGRGGFSISGSGAKTAAGTIGLGGSGGDGGDGKDVTVTNAGAVETHGVGATGVLVQSVGGGGGMGGFSISGTLGGGSDAIAVAVSVGGSGGGGGDAGAVRVTNTSSLWLLGDRASGIVGQSVGGGGGNGAFSIAGTFLGKYNASIAVGGSGGDGGAGGSVHIINSADIQTQGISAHAIKAESTSDGGGDGGFALTGSLGGKEAKNLAVTVGGSGGLGGTAGMVEIDSASLLSTWGDSSHGILATSIGGGGGTGGSSVSAGFGVSGAEKTWNVNASVSVGGSGGDGGAGGNVRVGSVGTPVSGSILTRGDDAHGILAQSIGGGGGQGGSSLALNIDVDRSEKNNTFSSSISVGGTGGGGNIAGAVQIDNASDIGTSGAQSHGILVQSIGGGGGSGGRASAMSLSTGDLMPWKEMEGENWGLDVSVGGSGGDGNRGGAVSISNRGTISTQGTLSRGIVAQSIGGGGGSGAQGILGTGVDWLDDALGVLSPLQMAFELKGIIEDPKELLPKSGSISVGGNGGKNGHAGTVLVKNLGDISTRGMEAHGIFAQSIGGGGGEAQLYARGQGEGAEASVGIGLLGEIVVGGAGGAAGNGSTVDIQHAGRIRTEGQGASGIFAQSIGGGGGQAGSIQGGFANLETIGLGLAFGRDGGSAGDGGAVTVTSSGEIFTSGKAAVALFAQSVGGGGGIIGDVGGIAFAGSVGGYGSGGKVVVKHQGAIITTGPAAHGIMAQSAGGMDNDEYQGRGGAVEVTVEDDVLVAGADASAILAQSLGGGVNGNGNITVNILGGTVSGGSGGGAGVRLLDGADNRITNHGAIMALSGMAIAGSGRNETVENHGIVTGNVDLGAGSNTFNNRPGSQFNSGGTVALGNGNLLNNAGILSPGGAGALQNTNVTGGLEQSASGKYRVDVDTRSLTADHVAISNKATLSGEAEISVFRRGRLLPGTYLINILTAAEGVSGAFTTETLPGSALLNYSLAYLPDAVQLKTNVADFRTVALPPAGNAVAQYLDKISPSATGDLADVLAEIQSLATPSALAAAFTSLSPESFDGLTRAASVATAAQTTQVFTRLGALRASNQISGRGEPIFAPIHLAYGGDSQSLASLFDGERKQAGKQGLWLEAFGKKGDQGSDADGYNGFDYRTAGITLGYDREFGENWVFGAALGYSRSDIDFSEAQAQGDINGRNLTLYGSWNNDGTYAQGMLSYGRNNYDQQRRVIVGSIDRLAASSHSGDVFAASLSGGFMSQSGEWSQGPYAALHYARIDEENFSETGAGGVDMLVGSKNTNSLSAELGLRALHSVKWRNGDLVTELNAAWSHDFDIDDRVITVAYAGAPGTSFALQGQNAKRNGAIFGAGLSYLDQYGMRASLRYQGEVREKYRAHAILGELRINF